MIKEDGTVIHFNNPKVQASLAANTFAITGQAENKRKSNKLTLYLPTMQQGLNYLLFYCRVITSLDKSKKFSHFEYGVYSLSLDLNEKPNTHKSIFVVSN